MKWKLYLIISVIVSTASLAIIFMLTYTQNSFEIMLRISPLFLLLAFLAHGGEWFFWALRIKILAHALGEKISIYRAFRIVMVNLFMAAITPSGFGGEPARIYMLSEGNLTGGDATAITLGERIIDFIFFVASIPILLLLLGLSINIEGVKWYLIIVAVILIVSGGVLYYLIRKEEKIRKNIRRIDKILKLFVRDESKREKIIDKIDREFGVFSRSTVKIFKKRKIHFTLAFLFTVMMWLIDFIIPSLLLLGLGMDPHWIFMITVQIIVIMITIIPITPGGSGLAEFSSLFFYSQRIPTNIAGMLVIMWRIITFYPNLIMGAIYTVHYLAKK